MVNPDNINNYGGAHHIMIRTPLALYPVVRMWVGSRDALVARDLEKLLRDLLIETGFHNYAVLFDGTPRQDAVNLQDARVLQQAKTAGLAIALRSLETGYTFHVEEEGDGQGNQCRIRV
jgi:hypothetical protein